MMLPTASRGDPVGSAKRQRLPPVMSIAVRSAAWGMSLNLLVKMSVHQTVGSSHIGSNCRGGPVCPPGHNPRRALMGIIVSNAVHDSLQPGGHTGPPLQRVVFRRI